MTLPDEGDYLTVPEIAKSLRVSYMTVYRLIHNGELDSILIGRGTIRVPREAYARYLRNAPTAAKTTARDPADTAGR